MAPRARTGLPRPDRVNLGNWIPITREDDPDAFSPPEDRRAALSLLAMSRSRAQETQTEAAGGPTEPPARSEDVGEDSAAEEVDDDDTGTYGAPRPRKRNGATIGGPMSKRPAQDTSPTPTSFDISDPNLEEEDDDNDDEEESEDDAPADTLPLDVKGWRVGDPKAQPLTYFVPSDANGGVRFKTVRYTINFDSSDSVKKANKTRRLEVWRARVRHGLEDEMMRESMVGREYTDENNEWLVLAHEDYAISNNGKQIPHAEITKLYNEHFDIQRTQASIASHMDRVKELKRMRASYA